MSIVKSGDVLICIRDVYDKDSKIAIKKGHKYTVSIVNYDKENFTLTKDSNFFGLIPFGCLYEYNGTFIHAFKKLNEERLEKIKSFLEN